MFLLKKMSAEDNVPPFLLLTIMVLYLSHCILVVAEDLVYSEEYPNVAIWTSDVSEFIQIFTSYWKTYTTDGLLEFTMIDFNFFFHINLSGRKKVNSHNFHWTLHILNYRSSQGHRFKSVANLRRRNEMWKWQSRTCLEIIKTHLQISQHRWLNQELLEGRR